MLFYTYYTEHERYKNGALALVEQAASFGLVIKAVPMENKKDWMLNALQRAQHLADMGRLHPDDHVGLLDSDVSILKRPDLLLKPHVEDVQVHANYQRAPDRRYMAGIVSFAPTLIGRRTLDMWGWLCAKDPACKYQLREQWFLCASIMACHPTVKELPPEYTRMAVPWEDRRTDDLVMIHNYDPEKPDDIDKRIEVPK